MKNLLKIMAFIIAALFTTLSNTDAATITNDTAYPIDVCLMYPNSVLESDCWDGNLYEIKIKLEAQEQVDMNLPTDGRKLILNVNFDIRTRKKSIYIDCSQLNNDIEYKMKIILDGALFDGTHNQLMQSYYDSWTIVLHD